VSGLGFLAALAVLVDLIQEADDFLTAASTITPLRNAVCSDSSVVAPAPQGVRMDMEDPGYSANSQHVTHMLATAHIFVYLLFD
jgi:hypothetical protein